MSILVLFLSVNSSSVHEIIAVGNDQ